MGAGGEGEGEGEGAQEELKKADSSALQKFTRSMRTGCERGLG